MPFTDGLSQSLAAHPGHNHVGQGDRSHLWDAPAPGASPPPRPRPSEHGPPVPLKRCRPSLQPGARRRPAVLSRYLTGRERSLRSPEQAVTPRGRAGGRRPPSCPGRGDCRWRCGHRTGRRFRKKQDERPSPVPFPTSLVVKNGSNARALTSSAIRIRLSRAAAPMIRFATIVATAISAMAAAAKDSVSRNLRISRRQARKAVDALAAVPRNAGADIPGEKRLPSPS